MWCVLKCRPGKREELIRSCRTRIPKEVLTDVFVFTCDRMRRYEGSWHMETKEMFPGYVFMETGNIAALSEWLTPYRGLAEPAGEDGTIRRIEPEEEALLRRLCGEEHHLGMSRGYIRNGVAHVVHGPLRGMERQIRRIDRHKRLADVTASLAGTATASDDVKAGKAMAALNNAEAGGAGKTQERMSGPERIGRNAERNTGFRTVLAGLEITEKQ